MHIVFIICILVFEMSEQIKETSVNPLVKRLEDLLKLLEDEEFIDPLFGHSFSLYNYVAPGKYMYLANVGIEVLQLSEWKESPYKDYLVSCSIILIESLRNLSRVLDDRQEAMNEYERQMTDYQNYIQAHRAALETYERQNCFKQIFTKPKFPMTVKKPLLKNFNIVPEISYKLPQVLSPSGKYTRLGRSFDAYGRTIRFRELNSTFSFSV
jgi:hypothetical protein